MTQQWVKFQSETVINNKIEIHQKLSFISFIAHSIIY